MKTLQDIIPNPDQRDEIVEFILLNGQALHPIGEDRYGKPVMQAIHIPNHAKFVQVIYRAGRKPTKKVFKPRSV